MLVGLGDRRDDLILMKNMSMPLFLIAVDGSQGLQAI